tara:strand:+ start:1147 stop:2859 length:1713 start_codon:yes stop_codon:yes gene_type:complete
VRRIKAIIFSVGVFYLGNVDAGSLSFSANAYSVAENSSTISITVNRTGSTAAVASVTVVSSHVTTEAGDFTPVSQSLSWGIGDAAAKNFTVTILDDNVVEGTETFTLSFTSPVGDGTGGSSTVSITDYEEGKLQLSSSTYSAQEDSLQLLATINRVSGTDGVASVKIKSTDSTPVASTSTDYFSVDTTLSFADGESSKTFLVNLKNDDIAEFSEKFTLSLSDATGAVLGAITSAIAEIKDTDIDFTSTLKLLTKSTKNIQQPQLVDLTQPSLLDSTVKIIDLINTIPILTLTDLKAAQETDGLLSILVETDKLFMRPVAVRRASSGLAADINLRDDRSADFITSQGWTVEAQPALKGISVFQKALAEQFLPDLVITENGNITIQMDQGAPPFERDKQNNIIVNYKFYDRWNFRPSLIAKVTDVADEGFSLADHPVDDDAWLVSVIFKDGNDNREQFLSSAPIDGPELIQHLKTFGVDRCAVISKPCTVSLSDAKQLENGIITLDVPSPSGLIKVALLADYKIRKTPNFTPSLVGFRETKDLNDDGAGDYRMIYSNGEDQYFFFVASYVVP